MASEKELLEGAKQLSEKELLSDAVEIEDSKKDSMKQLKAAALGAAQGATFGFEDELEAGAKSALSDKKYADLIKDIRARNKALEEEYPKTALAGELVGGVGSALLGGSLVGGVGKLLGLGKAATTGAEVGNAVIKGAELGGAVAKETAPSMMEVAAKLAQKTGTTMGAGATVGGLSAAGQSEATNIEDLGKDVLGGAESGALISGGLSGLGALAGTTLDRFSKTGTAKKMSKAFQYGREGEDLVGASNDMYNNLKDTVSGKLLRGVKDAEEKIQGKYSDLYKQADADISINPVDILQSANSFLDKLNADGTAKLYENHMNVANKILLNLSESGNEIKPTKVREAMNLLQKRYNDTYKSDAGAANIFLEAKKDLDTILNNKLKSSTSLDAQTLLDKKMTIDAEYGTLSNLKARFGIPKNFSSESGFQAGQEELYGLKDNLTNLAEKSVHNPAAASKLNEGLDILKKLSPESADSVKKDLSRTSELLNMSNLLGEESMLSSLNPLGHASSRSRMANIAYTAGKASRAAGLGLNPSSETVVAQVSSESPQAAQQVAEKLFTSSDEGVKKLGLQLNKIINIQDMTKRRALMFALNQQPAFRQAVEKVMPISEEGKLESEDEQ